MPGLYLDPTLNPDAYDTVVFNGTLSTPGKCKVTGWERPVEYDHKQGKGTKGAEQTLKGLPPAKGKIEFESWTPDQRAAWTPILDALKFDETKLAQNPSSTTAQSSGSSSSAVPSAGQAKSSFTGNTPNTSTTANQPKPLGAAFAIEIFYPTLADIDVHYVLPPEKLGIWEPVGEDFSHMKRTIDFVEYTGTPPNKSIAATPTGAADASSATQSPGQAPQAGSPGEGSAATNAAANQNTAASGAQGAWGMAA